MMYLGTEKRRIGKNEDDEGKEPMTLKNIIVLRGKENLIIPVLNIFYFFYENKNVFIVTKDNEVFMCEKRLSYIEDLLCSCFFRINRQIIVNYSAIQSYYYVKNDKIKLIVRHGHGRNMMVGKNKVAEFKRWIMFDCPCASSECTLM